MILIDTTPLVALCDGRDEKHRVAVKHLESLSASEFAVCDAVLTETCFHLPYPSQRQRLLPYWTICACSQFPPRTIAPSG